METTKQKLVASITARLSSEIAPQNPVKFLKWLVVEEIVDFAISIIYLYTRSKKTSKMTSVLMTEVITGIGHGLRNRNKLKRDSAAAAKAGAFILYSFEQVELLKVSLGKGSNHHATYVIEVIDDDKLSLLWEGLSVTRTEKLPSETPYAPWETTRHETGVMMVKTTNKDVLKKIMPETHPMIYTCINRAQTIGWQINEDIYPIYSWALRNKTDAFADIWEMHNPEAKQSKIREAKAIGSIAKRFIGKVFYH